MLSLVCVSVCVCLCVDSVWPFSLDQPVQPVRTYVLFELVSVVCCSQLVVDLYSVLSQSV